MTTQGYLNQCGVYFCLFLILMVGSTTTIHAQPLFPPGLRGNANLTGSPNESSQTEESNIIRDDDLRILGTAELYLINATKALQSGDTNNLNGNLSLSEQLFTSVLQNAGQPLYAENDTLQSIGLGGRYLVRALQTNDTNDLYQNVNLSLQQFAPVVGISPWTIIYHKEEAAELSSQKEGPINGGSQSGNFSDTKLPAAQVDAPTNGGSQSGNFSDTKLLALAGIHISHAIRATVTGELNSLNKNLNTSQEQIQQVLGG